MKISDSLGNLYQHTMFKKKSSYDMKDEDALASVGEMSYSGAAASRPQSRHGGHGGHSSASRRKRSSSSGHRRYSDEDEDEEDDRSVASMESISTKSSHVTHHSRHHSKRRDQSRARSVSTEVIFQPPFEKFDDLLLLSISYDDDELWGKIGRR